MPIEHSYNPADGFPRVMPSLRYEDIDAALAWLSDVFGLREHLRWTDSDGVVRHAEMRVGGAYIELSGASEESPSPKALGRASHSLVVLVDDVDAHFERSRAGGATIVTEPEDRPWGLRQYTAEDPEGHRWEFSEYLRHVPPAEWGAELSEPSTPDHLDDDPFAYFDEDDEEFLAALDDADRHAVGVLRDALSELRGAPAPEAELSSAASGVRDGFAGGHHPYGWLRAGAGFGDNVPAEDSDLLLSVVAGTISPREETGLDTEEESTLLVMEHADWGGAVIEMCRAGAGVRAEPEDLVKAIDECPEIDGTTDPDDVTLTETAFELVLFPWGLCGVVDEDRRLTPLGLWILPRALAQAWGGDFDAESEPGAA